MITLLNAEFFADVRKITHQNCVDLAGDLADAMLGVNDVLLSPAERIARFVDYANMGLLDVLNGMGAPVYWKLVREFVDDMSHSPLMQPVALAQPIVDDITRVLNGADTSTLPYTRQRLTTPQVPLQQMMGAV